MNRDEVVASVRAKTGRLLALRKKIDYLDKNLAEDFDQKKIELEIITLLIQEHDKLSTELKNEIKDLTEFEKQNNIPHDFLIQKLYRKVL